MFRRKAVKYSAILLLACVSLAAVQTTDIYFQIRKQLTIFNDIFREVIVLYVDEMPPESLVRHGIHSMLESLDPYSSFIDEGEQHQMEILSSGNYGGIGFQAGYRGDRVVVVAPLEGYPAERAGMRPGDIILSIDSISIEGMSPEEVEQLTIGDVGTELRMEVQRPGVERPVSFEMVRERIEVKNIRFADKIGPNGNIAYLQLVSFGQNASGELRDQLTEFNRSGELQGLILDLRNNPGGLLQEAIEVIDKFIEPGVTVLETRGRTRQQSNVYVTSDPVMFEDLPIVVLLNGGSASASEVVAGALQDLDRAVILGETSFGKGLVQTVLPLSYDTSLKLTVARYYTPSGRSIQSVEYTHDPSNPGRVIADSLRKEYRTKNGRKVYDGMGIEPDIIVRDPVPSPGETALRQQNQYFLFINDYLSTNNRGEEQDIPEDLYDRFMDYLDSHNFDYQTTADQQISELRKSDIFDDASGATTVIDELNQLVQSQKMNNLQKNSDRIEQTLQLEWLSHTAGLQERIRASLPSDRHIRQSLTLLSSRPTYDDLLTP